MDTDSFLLALRRFAARRGKPYELLCDQGTNFCGGERELQEAFASLKPELQEQLAKQNIDPLTHRMLPTSEEHGREKSNLSSPPYKDLILPEE
ncbi:hypothetical protein M9458_017170, partial [Cirrhinus mrigala]